VLLKAIRDSRASSGGISRAARAVKEEQTPMTKSEMAATPPKQDAPPVQAADDADDDGNDGDSDEDSYSPTSSDDVDAEVGGPNLSQDCWSVVPVTPRQPRVLVRMESAQKDADARAAASRRVSVPDGVARFRAFTAAVAKAFRGAVAGPASQLTTQEIAKAIGDTFGADEMLQGLQRLSDEEKVFLTGDLVFLL